MQGKFNGYSYLQYKDESGIDLFSKPSLRQQISVFPKLLYYFFKKLCLK